MFDYMLPHFYHIYLRKNVFPIRITEPWNSLPDTVVTAKPLESFKTRLDTLWYTQDIVYNFEPPLGITNNRTGTRDLILIDYENEELITEDTESYDQNCPKVFRVTVILQ